VKPQLKDSDSSPNREHPFQNRMLTGHWLGTDEMNMKRRHQLADRSVPPETSRYAGFLVHPRASNTPVSAYQRDENRGENWRRCTWRTRYAG